MLANTPNAKRIFERLGVCIGRHPWLFLTASLIITVLFLAGLSQFSLQDNIRTGYTPQGAQSIIENQIYADYYNLPSKYGVHGTGILVEAKDNGSMLTRKHLKAAAKLHSFIHNNFSVVHPVYGKFSLGNTCGLRCNINDGFLFLKKLFDEEMDRQDRGESPSPHVQLEYPQATIYGRQYSLFNNLAGVTTAADNDTNRDSQHHSFTNIRHAKYVIFWIVAGSGRFDAEKEALVQWEVELYHRSNDVDFDPDIRFYAYGDAIANQEVLRAGFDSVPFVTIGASVMVGFVLVTMLGSAAYYHNLDAGQLLVVAAAVICPVLGAASSLGAVLWWIDDCNVLMVCMTPFLVLGIGVDDAFLMMHSWHKLKLTESRSVTEKTPRETSATRLGRVFAEVGPSVTITSITNSLAFTIGAMVPIPQIQLFSVNTALAILLDYVFQLIVFGPVIVLTDRKHNPQDTLQQQADSLLPESKASETERASETTRRASETTYNKLSTSCGKFLSDSVNRYCTFLTLTRTRIAALLIAVTFYSAAYYGIETMPVTFSPERTVPIDSLLVTKVMPAMNRILNNSHDLPMIVQRPPDIENQWDYLQFMEMVHKLETSPYAQGSNYTLLWLRDYVRYVKSLRDRNIFFSVDNQEGGSGDDLKWDPILNYRYLPSFGKDVENQAWADRSSYKFIKSKDGSIRLTSMTFGILFKGMETWAIRSNVLAQTRRIIQQYPQFSVSVWDYDGPLLDLILQVKTITVTAGVITMGCMFCVSSLFVPSLLNVICATFTIGSICFGVLGMLSWWDCAMDPVTMVNILMAVGFCVDYTAHVTYHYYHQHRPSSISDATTEFTPADRLSGTFNAVAWPMFQAGVSSALCIGPLLFYSGYVYKVFGKTIVVLTALGTLHGLFLLPVALVSLPQRYLYQGKYKLNIHRVKTSFQMADFYKECMFLLHKIRPQFRSQ